MFHIKIWKRIIQIYIVVGKLEIMSGLEPSGEPSGKLPAGRFLQHLHPIHQTL